MVWRWLAGLMALVWWMGAMADGAALRVGTAVDRPPLSYRNEGQWVGAEADFARVLATQLGRPLQPVVMEREALLPALQRGEVDIVMAGLVIDDAALAQADFAMPYQKSGLMPVIRVVDVQRFHGPGSLMQGGYRLGYTRDSGAGGVVARLLGIEDGVAFDSAEQGLQALLDGRIDLLLDRAPTSWRLPTEPRYGDLMSLDQLLTEEPLAWAVRKGDDSWRRRIDAEMERMRQTGVLQHILGRWVPVQPQ